MQMEKNILANVVKTYASTIDKQDKKIKWF